ncbi:MAG: type IV pilus assembly protein PilM [Nitrospirae bacterium]|nr:type IV pilus assembly protein PilM [Nitrospirota bacterium]
MKEKIELSGAALIEFPSSLNGEKAKEKKNIREALEKALGEMGTLKGKALSMATQGPSVYIRYVKLPPVDTTRIAQIVNYEAQQQIPLPLEEVIWDYQVLKKKAMDIKVVLVATKAELINKLLEEVSAFRIEPEVVDYSPLAFYNCLKFNQELSEQETSILLDIGAKSTEMSIEREGSLCWTRSIPIGGHDLTQAIQQSFGMDFAEAEKMKREKRMVDLEDEKKKFTQVIIPVLSRLVNDIGRSLTFFQAELGGTTIDRIFLSGGGAELANLDKFLEKELKIEVKKSSLLKNIHLPNGFPLSGQESSFAVAVGLALRPLTKCASEISLLPIEITKKKEFQKRKGYFIFSFVLTLLIAVMAYAFARQDYDLKKNQLATIEEKLKKYQKYEQPIGMLKGEIGTITERLETLKKLTQGKEFWLTVLLELSRLVPDEVSLNSFSQENGILFLEGEAPTIPVIRGTVFELESSPFFGKVEAGTPQRIRGKEEFYQFSLQISLESFPFKKSAFSFSNKFAPVSRQPVSRQSVESAPPEGSKTFTPPQGADVYEEDNINEGGNWEFKRR